MANITINNYGTINICENITQDDVNKKKDELLSKMYYARYKQTLGGYEGWLELLRMYYCGEYAEMCEFIKSCRGKGGKTRSACLECLAVIMKGGTK